MTTIRPAADRDLPPVLALLRDAQLPSIGLTDHFPSAFVVAERDGAVVGVCGIEPWGDVGLLRSLAVSDTLRGHGLGRRLVAAVLERAQALSTVYLLTKTAGPFFRHLGFGSLGRDQTPAALQRAPELAAETCSSARLMWRPLRAAQGPGAPLTAGSVHRDPLGVHVLAHLRDGGEPQVVLGPRERALLAEMPWPLRRSEWLAGRRVAKQLLHAALDFAPERVEVLPLESGAPAVWVDGAVREGLTLSLSHTRTYAVAAVASHPVGVDVCDDVDGARLPNIAQRVLSEGEAEECDAHRTAQTQAAVWALKEAGLKLRIGGVFEPGARSVRVACLEPAAVADPTMRVTLLRLPLGAVALAVEQG